MSIEELADSSLELSSTAMDTAPKSVTEVLRSPPLGQPVGELALDFGSREIVETRQLPRHFAGPSLGAGEDDP